ncbi:MAG: PAS domain-containing protein [Burkholderiaceae bacterium]|nr:PAS domain-containing protein [Burkholderiaceae bacterium]
MPMVDLPSSAAAPAATALPPRFDASLARRLGGLDLRWVRAGLLLLNLLAAALCAAMLHWRWQDEMNNARLQATSTAALLARSAGATLDQAGLALAGVTDQIEQDLRAGGIDTDALWALVDQATARVPELLTVGLFDGAGRQICGAPMTRCRHLDIADRDYFARLRRQPDAGTLLIGPLTSRYDGRDTLLLVRAMRQADGGFAGVAVGLLPLQRLQPLVGTAALGRHGVASLRMVERLQLLARSPELGGHADAAQTGASSPLAEAQARQPRRGVLDARSANDGVDRLIAYQRLERHPVLAIVGEAHDDFLLGWQVTLAWSLAFIGVFAAASLALERVIALSQRRLLLAQTLYDQAPCGYHTLDDKARYLSINATELGWLGCTREQALGKLGPADFASEASRARIAASHARLLQGGGVQGVELELTSRDGRLRQVVVSASPVLDSQGRFVSSNSVMHDITVLKQAEQARLRAIELEAQNLALREAARVKNEFLSNMSHELRTPLNAVIGLAQLLQMPTVHGDAAKRARYAQQIEASGLQLLAMVQTLLDHGLAEAGKLSFQPQPLQVEQALYEVVLALQSASALADVSIDVDLEQAPPSVVNDGLRLRQMIQALVDNAIKFSHPGGRVRLAARVLDERWWTVTVSDQGLGMDPADLGRLFQSFVQLSSGPTKTHGGAGMGLALVRQIARAQGGDVTVSSQPGVGSVFTLTLPRRLADRGQDSGQDSGPAPG